MKSRQLGHLGIDADIHAHTASRMSRSRTPRVAQLSIERVKYFRGVSQDELKNSLKNKISRKTGLLAHAGISYAFTERKSAIASGKAAKPR